MNRLLCAGFCRLRRDKFFWICAFAVLAVSLLYAFTGGVENYLIMLEEGREKPLEHFIFELAPFLSMFFAALISLFLGSEYTDGGIRGKLIVGHTRGGVYFSNFLVCFAADLVLTAVFLLGQIPCFVVIGAPDFGWGMFAAYILALVCYTAAFTAIFCAVSMHVTNRALSVIVCIAVWTVLILAASGMNDRLLEPELTGGMAYINGEFVMADPEPNPLYVSGTARAVLERLLELLPSGPAILMTNATLEHPARAAALMLVLSAAVNAVGMLAFRRKNLK